MNNASLGGKVTALRIDGIEDSRGILLPVYFEDLDFSPVRAFLVKGRDGTIRGGHAHRQGKQLLLRVSGEIQVDLSLAGEEMSLVLGPEANAVMFSAPVWSRQTYRGEAPNLMIFSDQPYNPSAYIIEPG